MDIKKLQAAVIDALEDIKAQDIRVYDTMHLTSMFDRLAIASGTSNRQTKALAASVRDKVKEKGGNIVSIEGEDTGEWVLVDLGDMVVHIMQPAIRDNTRQEGAWGAKEGRFGGANRVSKRTDEDEEAGPKKRSGHLTATQTTVDEEPAKPARKAPAKKAASKTAAKTASKSTKTAKAPTGKTVKVAAAKTAAPRKTAAKRATKKAAG